MNKDRKLLRPELNESGLGTTSLRKLPNSTSANLLKKALSLHRPLFTSKFQSNTKFTLKSKRNLPKSPKNVSTSTLINTSSNFETRKNRVNNSIVKTETLLNNSSGTTLGSLITTHHSHNQSNPTLSVYRSLKHTDSSIRRSHNHGSLTNLQSASGVEEEIVEIIEVPKLPTTAPKALKYYKDSLTLYEHGEILDYREVYYLGKRTDKIQPSISTGSNCGFDDEKGDYNVIAGDHIAYRYEIIAMLGKGSFGIVLKVFDHKNKVNLALKIIKNKPRFNLQAEVEIKILNYLREHDKDNEFNIIHYHNCFKFRHHLVTYN
jgi:hypothetical protein